MSNNSIKSGSKLNSARSSRARNLAPLKFVVVALIFFAFGYNTKNLDLPSWLRPSGSSSVRVDGSVDVDVQEIYAKLKERFDGELDPKKVELGIKRGLVSATGDPYTTYFTAAEYAEFESSLNGQFSGIGAELGIREGRLVVIAPIDGTPAQKAGLMPGDIILAIDGESTEGISVDAAVKEIRGESGTKVKLRISSDGQQRDVEITRSEIRIESVEFEKLGQNIGYIKISQFSTDTYSQVSRAVGDLRAQGAKDFILDLRNNGGGYVDSAVNIAGIWLDNKVVLSERFRGQEVQVRRTPPRSTLELGNSKLVVLVNEGSASASEILAAALNENAGVQLVGQKTFGKGSVQDVVELGDGARLKITIARWFTPNGKSIDGIGVEPTIKVEFGAPEQDLQKQKAIDLLNY
jgi:carboxyl-terminal processing protease